MSQTKAHLPPKAGYVEITDIYGNPVYKRLPTPLDSVDSLLVDQEYRITLLELGITKEV